VVPELVRALSRAFEATQILDCSWIVGKAYKHRSLMVTSNLSFEEWTEIFSSERLTGALLDRLTHRCHIIETNGESYRLKQVKTTLTGKPK